MPFHAHALFWIIGFIVFQLTMPMTGLSRQEKQQAGEPDTQETTTAETTTAETTTAGTTTAENSSEATSESQQPPKIKFDLGRKSTAPILRAKRPKVTPEQKDAFFDDFYRDALVGQAPDWNQLGNKVQQSLAGNNSGGSNNASANGGVFDALISPSTIEDEIKKTANELTTKITTPVKFKSDYRDVHQSYSQLATLFAINEVYQSEVRWHDDAAAFRELMGKTAAGTRVSTPQAYQMAVQSREDLQQIIRGGRASVTASGDPLEDWGLIIDRTPMMTWLETLTQESMKEHTSNEKAIQENAEELKREAELIAAIAQVLLQPEMDEYSDDDYAAHSEAMKKGALDIISALEVQNFEGVQDAMNVINQSCDDCHGDFR